MFVYLYEKSIGDSNEVVLYFIIYDFPTAPCARACISTHVDNIVLHNVHVGESEGEM